MTNDWLTWNTLIRTHIHVIYLCRNSTFQEIPYIAYNKDNLMTIHMYILYIERFFSHACQNFPIISVGTCNVSYGIDMADTGIGCTKVSFISCILLEIRCRWIYTKIIYCSTRKFRRKSHSSVYCKNLMASKKNIKIKVEHVYWSKCHIKKHTRKKIHFQLEWTHLYVENNLRSKNSHWKSLFIERNDAGCWFSVSVLLIYIIFLLFSVYQMCWAGHYSHV